MLTKRPIVLDIKARILLKSIQQLGIKQAGYFGLYQVGLKSGYYLRKTPNWRFEPGSEATTLDYSSFCLPSAEQIRDVLGENGCNALQTEAEEICSGKIRLFGGRPVVIDLGSWEPRVHWTKLEQGIWKREAQHKYGDIKFSWEVGRFGWAITLARAYCLFREERYADIFWDYYDRFISANPPYVGPNWLSAQEAALRLIALVFSIQIFSASPATTLGRMEQLKQMLVAHARRIPVTLAYAKAQNNNHLLSEAAGLYTLGVFLRSHPEAEIWRQKGWSLFNQGIQSQIAEDGNYVQHSTNYHRLMLQLALWMYSLAKLQSQALPAASLNSLKRATHWLLRITDPANGHTPNLGPNDGAYIFPFVICPRDDYRPVLQAASAAFLGKRAFNPGAWDEMTFWFGFQSPKTRQTYESSNTAKTDSPALEETRSPPLTGTPHILEDPDCVSRAYFRAVHFSNRPGHADQLHLDLWWQNVNIALDAGTYLYNGFEPWENSLTSSQVHNTVTINHQEQMWRAGRFLYLDWAQAKIVKGEKTPSGNWQYLKAQHDGYRKLGLLHQRSVTAQAGPCWIIEDNILPVTGRSNRKARSAKKYLESFLTTLHWLVPDWLWEIEPSDQSKQYRLKLESPMGVIRLRIGLDDNPGDLTCDLQLTCCGMVLYGDRPVSPHFGWMSPTYGEKLPALAIRLFVQGRLPVRITSVWELQKS